VTARKLTSHSAITIVVLLIITSQGQNWKKIIKSQCTLLIVTFIKLIEIKLDHNFFIIKLNSNITTLSNL
jgi:hypothetical protein